MRWFPSSSNFGSVLVDFFTDFGFFQPFFSDHLCSFVFFSIEGDDSSEVGIGVELLSSPASVFQTFVSGVFGSDTSSGVSALLSQSGRSS